MKSYIWNPEGNKHEENNSILLSSRQYHISESFVTGYMTSCQNHVFKSYFGRKKPKTIITKLHNPFSLFIIR